MSERDQLRWRSIAEREALGEPIGADDEAFCRALEEADPALAEERAAWRSLLGALADPLAIDDDATIGEDDAFVDAIVARHRAGREVAGGDVDAGAIVAVHRVSGGVGGIGPEEDALTAAILAQHHADALVGEVAPVIPMRRWRRSAAGLAAGLALAAGVALMILSGKTGGEAPALTPSSLQAERAERPPAPAPLPAPSVAPAPAEAADEIVIALASPGGVQLGGVRAATGDLVAEGATLTSAAETCMVFRTAPFASVCVAPGSEVEVREARGGRRKLTLARGALVATLDKIPSGGAFTVSTAEGEARAVGTIFAVEIADAGASVGVIEGVIEVRRPATSAAQPLRAGEHASFAAPAAIAPLPASLQTWSEGHAAMAGLWRDLSAPSLLSLAATPAELRLDDHPLIAGALELLIDEGAHDLEIVGPRGAGRSRRVVGDPAAPTLVSGADLRTAPRASRPSEAAPTRVGPTIAELRREASDARAAGTWRAAADAYGALIDRYPDAPEAQNARVQLGELLRGRLGQPARALEHFDAYLARGGPLAAEARVGRVRALQQLGRRDDEAAAIADFLEHHPGHIEAAKLRQRSRELASP